MPRAPTSSLLALALAGCGHFLPEQSSTVPTSFDSFGAAQRAVEQVVPFRTTVDDLRRLGFDVEASANVTLIPYPELVSRLAPNPSVPFDELDAGIRACILSRMACEAYQFEIGQENRRRTGGFWSDFLNFKRVTSVTGWHFQTLVVVRDGVVLFRNWGGEPHIRRTEQQRNPLGPLQPAGEAAGGLVTR
ncbi:MAG TPA: hypothetical protein VFZ93_06315 [Albitalea sp.]